MCLFSEKEVCEPASGNMLEVVEIGALLRRSEIEHKMRNISQENNVFWIITQNDCCCWLLNLDKECLNVNRCQSQMEGLLKQPARLHPPEFLIQ